MTGAISGAETGPEAGSVPMVGLWRGGRLESLHRGHAVVCDAGGIVESWGNAGAVIYPRSSCKMLQALPLVESGAADAAGLTDRHLALACASHQGAALHVGAVQDWLANLGLGESDLRCGAHEPYDRAERDRLIRAGSPPCQCHNNCSGKHVGMLTATRHLRAGPEYVAPDHVLQTEIRAAFDQVTGEPSPGYGIDGCSAPNFATSLAGLGRAMAFFATARDGGGRRESAAARLTRAMAAHPDMVAGEGRACTDLMRAMGGRVAVKTGAEGVFVAIAPDKGLGMAVKITDGAGRAAEAVIAALLVRHGLADAAHPAVIRRMAPVQRNWRGLETGILRPMPGLA